LGLKEISLIVYMRRQDRKPIEGGTALSDHCPIKQNGIAIELAGLLELRQKRCERFGIVGLHQAQQGWPFGQELGAGFEILARASNGVLGADPGLFDAGQSLIVGQLVKEADSDGGHAHDGEEEQANIDSNEEGTKAQRAHRLLKGDYTLFHQL
jgi:hypothetical protein